MHQMLAKFTSSSCFVQDVVHRRPYEVLLLAVPAGGAEGEPPIAHPAGSGGERQQQPPPPPPLPSPPQHLVVVAVPGEHSRKPQLGRLLRRHVRPGACCLEVCTWPKDHCEHRVLLKYCRMLLQGECMARELNSRHLPSCSVYRSGGMQVCAGKSRRHMVCRCLHGSLLRGGPPGAMSRCASRLCSASSAPASTIHGDGPSLNHEMN